MAMSPFLIPIVFFIPFISQMGLPEVSLLYCLFENRISSWIYLLISLCFCFLIHLFLPVSLMFFFSLSFPIGAVFILFFFKRSQNECWLILFLSPFLIIKAFKAMRTVPAVSHRFGYVAFWFQCFSKYLSVDSLFLSWPNSNLEENFTFCGWVWAVVCLNLQYLARFTAWQSADSPSDTISVVGRMQALAVGYW